MLLHELKLRTAANDSDGKQVKAVVGSTTTYYVGMHYQVDNGVVTKYYTSTSLSASLAGASRIAMRKNGTLYYLLGDHLGSTSLTLNSSGSKIAELRYKACPLRFAAGVLREGETRYSSGTTYTAFQFTGQRNETALGLYFYNARWYDPYLNRFTQPDSIVPGGVQGYDRYAYANNNPVRYTDPTGHCFEPVSGVLCTLGIIFIGVSVAMLSADSANVDMQLPTFNQEQQDLQNWQNNCYGECHYSDAVSNTPGSTLGGPMPQTPAVDQFSEDMAGVVGGIMMTADGMVGLASNLSGAMRMVNVRHYTDGTGMTAISESGYLRSGSYVANPSEIPSTYTSSQIEGLLEIQPGRASYFTDFQVPYFRLRIPGNGPLTSGGAWQRQIIGAEEFDDIWWWLTHPTRSK